jgi:5'-3' exoribonuclease 2
MFNSVFEYVDKLIGIIRPKKFIYLAVDGVAPRAKMNQQRSRRFRAALESEKNAESQKNILKEWKRLGLSHPNESKKKGFDSNTITPGTPFMAKLTDALKVMFNKSFIQLNRFILHIVCNFILCGKD